MSVICLPGPRERRDTYIPTMVPTLHTRVYTLPTHPGYTSHTPACYTGHRWSTAVRARTALERAVVELTVSDKPLTDTRFTVGQ